MGKEKIFVLNDYLANRSVQFPDSYLVKTMLSDITDQDFSLGALECRLKKLDQGIQDFKATNRASSSTPLWLIVFSLISGVLVFISLRIGVWKSKPRK